MIFFGAPIKKHGLYLFFSVLLYISVFVLTQIAAQIDLLRLIPLFILVPLGSFNGWLPWEALPFFFGLTHLVQALRVIKQEQHSFRELLGVWNDQGDHQFGRLASIKPFERFSTVAIINSRFLAPYRLFHKLTRQDMQHALLETRARTTLQNRQILLQFIIFASFIFVVGWYRIGLFATGKYLTFLSFPLVLAMLLVFGGMVWLSKRQDLIASIDLWFDYEVAPRLIEGDAAAQAITQSLEKLTEQQDEHMNRLLELTESSRDSLAGGLSDLDNNLSNHADELSRIHTELLSLNHAVSKEGEAIRGAMRWESLDTFLESFSSETRHFEQQTERMLLRLHEKMIHAGEQLRACADTLRAYVERGGVADTALLHKALNDFREVVNGLHGRFDKAENIINELSHLPEAVSALAKAGHSVHQGGERAYAVAQKFGESTGRLDEIGRALSREVSDHGELTKENAQAIGDLSKDIATLQSAISSINVSLMGIQQAVNGVQQIMQRLAARGGF